MPNRFNPIVGGSDLNNVIAQVNKNFAQLDNESVVKVFRNANANAVVIGRVTDNRYGLLIADDTGTPRVFIGQAPDDGRPGAWVSASGQNVLTLLGG